MNSNQQQLEAHHLQTSWHMPILPESYDQSPLTEEERCAIAHCATRNLMSTRSKESDATRIILARLDQPIADIYSLRHRGRSIARIPAIQRIMHREMHRYGKIFWSWSPEEWMETLCSTPAQFKAKHGGMECCHMIMMDAAYLLGGVTDLRQAGLWINITETARAYFGKDLITQQCQRVIKALTGKGYKDGQTSLERIRRCLSMLFVLNRSPYLEDLTDEVISEVAAENRVMRQTCRKITASLQHLNALPLPPREGLFVPCHLDRTGMADEWYAWCQAWYEQAVDLTPHIRRDYALRLLAIGRWLWLHAPEVHTPEQWTEDLALRFRSDLCTWTKGQYGNDKGRHILECKGELGKVFGPTGIRSYLVPLRRYFTDLTKHPHAVDGAPARKIQLDFSPQDVLATPKHIKKALDVASPRDINLRTWAKLAIAAATLSQGDLPPGAQYPLSFYRALGLVWVTSARRPNEIARLRLDCLRVDWTPEMLDEDDQPVERLVVRHVNNFGTQDEVQEKPLKLHYLHIPSGKNRGAFWIWLPDYVAEAINAWKRERPSHQRKLLDRKDREEVDFLFCYRDARVGSTFINYSLIPTLCAKAGVDIEDAKGRITGHRGRSSRLTLLRSRGVSLDDLAEYAGHADTKTIRRYARQDPILLHHIVRDADDLSRIIEGVVDVQAASQGLPALRWFIGYDADGEPMYCGNQLYITCPHRLDCERCGMFIGGEKARLLHEGENTLPITSKVPMTPIEQCVVRGDQKGEAACRAALERVPAPETSDIRLIFNPEGLSYDELTKLALLGTPEALDKLHQALEAHEKRLEEMKQSKTGRNALVGAQKRRIHFIQELLAASLQQRQEQQGG